MCSGDHKEKQKTEKTRQERYCADDVILIPALPFCKQMFDLKSTMLYNVLD